MGSHGHRKQQMYHAVSGWHQCQYRLAAPGTHHAGGRESRGVVGHKPEPQAGLHRNGQGKAQPQAGAVMFIESSEWPPFMMLLPSRRRSGCPVQVEPGHHSGPQEATGRSRVIDGHQGLDPVDFTRVRQVPCLGHEPMPSPGVVDCEWAGRGARPV